MLCIATHLNQSEKGVILAACRAVGSWGHYVCVEQSDVTATQQQQ